MKVFCNTLSNKKRKTSKCWSDIYDNELVYGINPALTPIIEMITLVFSPAIGANYSKTLPKHKKRQLMKFAITHTFTQ
ncbi:hypothetical protein C4B25_00090 [Mycoplasma todarodis]|uniref:Uncharacterized protein n=1 Tax=Mycoplasma todarodis TaxID=1937191 RepID=A0A4R0XYD5_9MOLU|nr:hypothetical protein C4B25_00090 [Mycoplasma todarodis]